MLFGYNLSHYTQRNILQKHFSKKVNFILLLILILSLFGINSCQNKEENLENENIVLHTDTSLMETFTIINMQEQTHKMIISKEKMTIYDLEQPVVIVHIFDRLNASTRYQLRALDTLQQRYKNNLFVISLLIGESITTQKFIQLVKQEHLKHFISNDIENPTIVNILNKSLGLNTHKNLSRTLLYTDGEYTIHYEGATPIEMLEYNIKQAIKG